MRGLAILTQYITGFDERQTDRQEDYDISVIWSEWTNTVCRTLDNSYQFQRSKTLFC